MKNRSNKEHVRFARAFAMRRCKLGLIVEEQLVFSLKEDEQKNYDVVKEFAERQKCDVVEVWYREDDNWDECKHYKTYAFYPTLNGAKFDTLDIYGKRG